MKKTQYIAVAAALFISSTAWATTLTVPNTFTTGTPAVAAQVNGNFTATKTAVDDNDTRITANAASITALQNTGFVRTVNVSSVLAVGGAVDPLASGTALIAAVAGITGASVANAALGTLDNQYLVKLEPGVYDLGILALSLPTGVNLEGAGRDMTEIKSSVVQNAAQPRSATIVLMGNSVISNVKVTNTNPLIARSGVAAAAILLNGGASSCHFYNVGLFSGNALIIDKGSYAKVSSSEINSSISIFAIWKTGPSSKVDVISSNLFGIRNVGPVNAIGANRCFASHKNFRALSATCQ